MDKKAVSYGLGGLLLGVVLTILIGIVGMAGMMGGMGRMMRNMCGNQGSTDLSDASRMTNEKERLDTANTN